MAQREKSEGRDIPHGVRRFIAAVLLLGLVIGAGTVTLNMNSSYPAPVPLRADGLLGNHPGSFARIPPQDASGASYLPASNVLRLSDGRLRYLPADSSEPVTVSPDDPGALAVTDETRKWLEQGNVPGKNSMERQVSERALLDLRLLTPEGAATLAGPDRRWAYVWPRDASFAAAAFAATNHHEESYQILSFLARTQQSDGTWEARYRPDGSPVADGRAPQLDSTGWVPWAAWYSFVTDPKHERAEKHMRMLWPSVRAAADAASDSLGPGGLPPGGSDYWEMPTLGPNLGTAAPMRTGLRSAADIATKLGHENDAQRYARAAARLDMAIEDEFAPRGYPRTARLGSGADAAVNFLAPPFASRGAQVEKAVEDAASRLAAPNGGMLPGEQWKQDPSVSWTPETAFFALSASADGRDATARRYLTWLADHRTSLGSFPEKIDGDGKPQAAAPLAWTSAIVILALAAKENPLPVPPVYKTAGEPGPSPSPLAPLGGVLLGVAFLAAANRPRWYPVSVSVRP